MVYPLKYRIADDLSSNASYAVHTFYEGAPLPPLQPSYQVSLSQLGMATNPTTMQQLREAVQKFKTGLRTIEVGMLEPSKALEIPKEHFKEMGQEAKLAGVEQITFHNPLVEPSGIEVDQNGLPIGKLDEFMRKRAEEMHWQGIERAYLASPGQSVVTIHASHVPVRELTEEGKEEAIRVIDLINERAGAVTARYDLGLTPEQERERIQQLIWEQQLRNLWTDLGEAQNRVASREVLTGLDQELWKKFEEGKLDAKKLSPSSLRKLTIIESGIGLAKSIEVSLDDLIKKLDKLRKEKLIKLDETDTYSLELASKAIEEARLIDDNKIKQDLTNAQTKVQKIAQALHALRKIKTPEFLQPLNQFMKPHEAKTIANLAFKAFKKWGDKAPIITLENISPNTAFSSATELKDLVKEARKRFVEQAVKHGMDRAKAKEAAEKLIGVTWDVGHLNLLRRLGFGKEKIIEETKEIAPFIKKVHLTDNWGFADSHLAPGWGNVPFKEIETILKQKGIKVPQILEIGGMQTEFGEKETLGLPYALEAMSTPLYTAYMEPFWGQVEQTIVPYMYSFSYSQLGDSFQEEVTYFGQATWSGLPVFGLKEARKQQGYEI